MHTKFKKFTSVKKKCDAVQGHPQITAFKKKTKKKVENYFYIQLAQKNRKILKILWYIKITNINIW